jgi:phospholipase/carboxylesterase
MLAAGARTGAILTDVLGFEETAREGSLTRYRAPGDVPGNTVTIRETGGFLPGRLGRGSVHHVAFRAADDAEQAAMARRLVEAHAMHPTHQLDRQYFRSVYFREPGSILFEIATSRSRRSTTTSSWRRSWNRAAPRSKRRFRPSRPSEGPRDDRPLLHPPFRTGGAARVAAPPDPARNGRQRIRPDSARQDDLAGRAVLSPRGKVLEHGMPRFFRRLAEGVFDEDDVRARAHELADFVEAAREQYGLAPPVALGYSNGANIAAAVLLLRPQALAGGILLRAMVPLRSSGAEAARQRGADRIRRARSDRSPANAARLKAMLEQAGAQVDHRILPGGHELSQDDVDLARAWLQAQEAALPAAS